MKTPSKLAALCAALLLMATLLLPRTARAVGDDDFYGMFVSYGDSIGTATPKLDDMGVRWVRLWANIDWSNRSEISNAFNQARALKNAGFKVILLLNDSSVPSASTVTDYCDWVVSSRGSSGTAMPLGDAVDVWEILNELNVQVGGVGKYWEGTPAQYVSNVLAPAYESLHSSGEEVLGGSFTAWQNGTWGTGVTQAYVNADYLSYCDYAGTHPYTDTLTRMKSHLDAVKTIFGNKPIIITEWNFKSRANWDTSATVRAQWKSDWDAARDYFYPRVRTVCPYRYVQTLTSNEGKWPGFVVGGNHTPYQPFYDMYKNWPKTLTLAPIADAFVRSGSNAATNFGTATTLEAKTSGAEYSRDSFLKFDASALSGVSSGVSSAKLRVTGALSASGSLPIGVYGVANSSWGETTLTWNNKPMYSALLDSVTVASTTPTVYEWDVTSWVQNELAAGRLTISLTLHSTITSNLPPFLRANTRESARDAPQLVLIP